MNRVSKRFIVEPNEGLRVLFVGNSITYHGPNPNLRGLHNHPNDDGMRVIADRLWENIKATVKEYSSKKDRCI